MRRSTSWLVAVAFGVVGVLHARDAEGCSCQSANAVLSPPLGASHPLALPLVYYTNSTGLALTNDQGTAFDLVVVREAAGFGFCSVSYRFVVPTPPLSAGVEYALAPDGLTGEPPEWVSEHTVRFRASGESPGTTSVRLSIEALLEAHEPYESTGAECGDYRLEGRLLSRLATVHIGASPPVDLFVSATVYDPLAGPLVNTGLTSIVEDGVAYAGLGISVPDETSSCVDVQVFDVSGVDVYLERFCLEPDAPVSRMADVTVTVLDSSSVAEVERREGERTVYTRGCGCRVGERTGTTGTAWSAVLIAGLIGVGFVGRRPRRRNGS